jgi:hypothetical protein
MIANRIANFDETPGVKLIAWHRPLHLREQFKGMGSPEICSIESTRIAFYHPPG